MPKCKPIRCPEACVPLLRYFVNQQPAILNTQQTITPDCPVGFTCENDDPFDIPAGRKRVVPDVDPLDPDINPNCDYNCEANQVFDNPNTLMNPRLLVGNDEATATCEDVGLDPDGLATFTIPAGVLMRTLGPNEFAPLVKAELNQQAMELAKQRLLQDIADGVQTCWVDPFTVPLEIWETGLNEPVGFFEYTVADPPQYYLLGSLSHGEIKFRSEDVCERVYFTTDPGIYQEWYRMPGLASGAFSRLGRQFGSDPVGSFINFSGTPNRSMASCAATALAEILFPQPSMPNFDSLGAPQEKVFVLDKRAAEWTHPDWTHEGLCNVSFTRISKPVFDPYDYLKRVFIDDGGQLTSVYKGSYFVNTAQPEWDRSANIHNYGPNELRWWLKSGTSNADASIGGKLLQAITGVRWHGDVGREQFGAPPGPNVAVWVVHVRLTVQYGLSRPWLSFVKLDGASPEGLYFEMPELVPEIPSLLNRPVVYLGALDTATNDPLPASTLAAGQITANVNGTIPEIGGVTLANGNKLLVKDEANAARNGPYVVVSIGSAGSPWVIERDAQLNADWQIQERGGFMWKVTGGDNSGFWQLMNEGVTIDTDPLAFAPYALKTVNVSYLP